MVKEIQAVSEEKKWEGRNRKEAGRGGTEKK
jgi:hypothetical protein